MPGIRCLLSWILHQWRDFVALLKMLIFLLLLNVFSSLHKCVVCSLSFLVSVLLRRNVSLCFWATVSALVCLVCSSTVVRKLWWWWWWLQSSNDNEIIDSASSASFDRRYSAASAMPKRFDSSDTSMSYILAQASGKAFSQHCTGAPETHLINRHGGKALIVGLHYIKWYCYVLVVVSLLRVMVNFSGEVVETADLQLGT